MENLPKVEVKKAPMPAAILEALRLGENETTSTIGHGGARIWLYPREVAGYFIQRRVWVGWLLICIYLGMPWLRWRGEAIFRIDVFERKLIFFGHYFFAQDIRLFLPGIFSFVLIVFLVTATWGRIWCGWACPQTVFLQFLFGPIEKLIEGKAAKRQKRDSLPIHLDWIWRKVAKHLVFALAAL
jgi:polyferredoxin